MVQVTPLPNITVQNLTGSNLLMTRPGSTAQESVSVGDLISIRVVPSQNFSLSISTNLLDISPALYANSNQHYSAIVGRGFLTLSVAKYSTVNSFYSPTASIGASGFFTAQTGNFSISWDSVPSSSTIDAVCGLSSGATSAFTDLACIVRFSSAGVIDARNGGAYAAAASVPYTGGQSFHFRLNVRVPTKTYDVYVTPSGQSEVLLGSNYSFRSEQSGITSINHLGVIVTTGNVTFTNMVVGLSLSVPKYTSTNVFYTATMTGGIRTLNPAKYIRDTVFYAPTISLASSGLTYPKGMNDPMFTNMVEQNSVLTSVEGTTYNNYSWLNFYGGSVTVWAANNTTFNKLRMQTNEGFRFGGQTNVVIDQMYLEVSDPDPEAHADGIQWYTNSTAPPGGGPGSFSSLTIRNSHLRGLSGAYTLMLIADWSCGNITFENCLFTTSRQGCQGFVFNPQNSMLPQTVTVSVKDCYVQANDWGDGGSNFNGDCFKINTTTGSPWNIHPCTVSLWQNVNYCTWNHSTGVLTPGAAYPKPTGT